MSQPLQLSFQANTDQARNAIAQLAGTVSSNMVTIGKTMKDAYGEHERLTNTMAQLPSIAGRSAVGLVALGVAVVAIGASFALFEKAASTAADQVKKLQDIQKGSTEAGISSTFYQDQVRDLQRFGMTAEEAAKSLIKAKEALSSNVDQSGGLQDPSIVKTLRELRDTGFAQLNEPVNRLLGAAPDDIETKTKAARDAMKALHDAAADTGKVNLEALADQIGRALGYSKDATEEVKRLGDASREAGTNFDEGLVRQSKELDQKIADVHLKLANDLQPIMIDLARLGLVFKDAWYGTLTPIENAIGAIGRAYGEMKRLADERSRMGEGSEITIPGAKQSFLTPAARRGVAGRLAPESTQDLAEGTGDAQEEASLARRTELAGLPGPGDRVPVPLARPPDLGKKAAKEAAEALDTYMDQLKKSVAVLEAENRTFGLSNTAKARDVDLTKAQDAARRDAEDGKRTSKELTEEETKAVLAQADAEGKAKDRTEQLQRAQAAANEQAQLLGNSLMTALDSIGESGKKATDVLKEMVKTLIRAVEQALLLGSGPFAELFGTAGKTGQTGGLAGFAVRGIGGAFGGGAAGFEGGAGDVAGDVVTDVPAAEIFAEGGMAGHSKFKKYIPRSAFVGASQFAIGGAIPAILHPGEVILNAAQQRNVAGSMTGGAKINLTHAPVINGTGLSKEEVFSIIQRSQKEFARQIGPIFSDWQRRFA